MSPAKDLANSDTILSSLKQQLADLNPASQKLVERAAIGATLGKLESYVKATAAAGSLVAPVQNIKTDVSNATESLADFGPILTELYDLQQQLEALTLPPVDNDRLETLLLSIIASVRQLLSYRPDVGAIMDDLTAIKNLRGGPADAVAFHDFHVLQLAFRSIWMHAFDVNLQMAAEELYEQTVRLYDDAGVVAPPLPAIDDIDTLKEFVKATKAVVGYGDASKTASWLTPSMLGLLGLGGVIVPPPPPSTGTVAPPPLAEVLSAFPEASRLWEFLSPEQIAIVQQQASIVNAASSSPTAVARARKLAQTTFAMAAGSQGRLSQLILEIEYALGEPYAFDVFAPDSYNYGLMVTYRQRWEPGEYQAGDLVSTIPLAPGETRKFSKKRAVKTSRATKEIEKSMSSRKDESSEISRAETEIMQKTTTATNFKMTSKGSFNIGIGSIESTSEFAADQAQISSQAKKAFHEATVKAAEEYRLERSIEIDTTSSEETEEISSGEISNPNNELTVTYLFYELQRRYKIREFLYRVRPVILVAQDVPSPHEIDEAWLIQHQWIISRVLLDDMFRPALNYLNTGMAGDEVSIAIIRANWEKQRDLERFPLDADQRP